MAIGVPQTVWRDSSGLVEYGTDGPNYVVDTTDFYLVDPSGFYITDTGASADLIPRTIWSEDDSI